MSKTCSETSLVVFVLANKMTASVKIAQRQAPETSQEKLYRAGFSPLIARILAGRGIVHERQCTPLLEKLLPPDTMKDLSRAVTLCIDAIQKKMSVLIVGDYDCDGATATALMVSALRRWGVTTNYIIPNRETMGYGLSHELALLILQSPPDLVITVDNGIASIQGIKTLSDAGVKVLVTDHHLPAEHLPAAHAIINPNQQHCPFPSKMLSGVGVAFYLLIAVRATLRQMPSISDSVIGEIPLGEYLDLVALGTVADLVSLDENNRILVHFGLKRIREGRARPGINALLRVAGRRIQSASTSDLGFYVAPRINAAGRMTDMTMGIECLLATDDKHAEVLADQLSMINQLRRNTETQMKADAINILDRLELPQNAPTITLSQADWHLGVIGIVASRIKDKTGKPTFIFSQDKSGHWRGSGRSVPGLHLRDCLEAMSKQYPQLFISFGGHSMAAGATIVSDPSITFAQSFAQHALMLCPSMQSPITYSDGMIEHGDLNVMNVEAIEGMVWGQGFSAPLFHDTFTIDRWQNIKDRHWKLWVHNDRLRTTALFFNVPETITINPQRQEACFTFGLMSNYYQGRTEVVIRVEHWLST